MIKTMNIHNTQKLLSALSNRSIVGKALSGNSFFSVICLKKKAQDHINSIIEAEAELAKAYGIDINDQLAINGNKEFLSKLKDVQKDFETKELNFIPRDEFKAWVEHLDLETASVLYEFLVVVV